MRTKYLLDTNILVHHQRGYFDIEAYLNKHDISLDDCYVSEITVIEMKVGEIILKKKGYQFSVTARKMLSNFTVLPISPAIDNDEPGERLFLQLQNVLPNLEHHQLPPGCKDFGEYYEKLRVDLSYL